MDYTMAKLTELLEQEFKHWEQLYQYGGYDPFYADGMNLNLTKNHISYYKRQMEELVGKETTTLFGSEFPEIYYRETPPKVDNNYMAQSEAIRERAKEQIALYEKDENFQYLFSIKDTLYPNHNRTKEMKNAQLPFYPVIQLGYYKKSYEEDDLVAMRRDFHIDDEEKKEPLDAKIERLTANNTAFEPKSSKQKDTNNEKLFQKEEQLTLF